RGPDHHLVDVLQADSGLGRQRFSRLAQLRDDCFRGAPRGAGGAASDHRASQVDEGRADPDAADIEAEHEPCTRVHVVELRARTWQTAGPPHPPEQAEVDELPEHLGDRRLGQARAAHNVGRGHGAAGVHQLERGAQVDGAKQTRLRRFRCRHPVCLLTNVSKGGYLRIVADGPHGPLGSLSICHANAIGVAALRSSAGSSVYHDCTLSWYTAVVPLNCANLSRPAAGQVRMPATTPVAAKEFGPSTVAPARIGGAPLSEPARLATWCCMQSG